MSASRRAASPRGCYERRSGSRTCGAWLCTETRLGAQPKVSARGYDDEQRIRSQAAVEAEPTGQAATEEDGRDRPGPPELKTQTPQRGTGRAEERRVGQEGVR